MASSGLIFGVYPLGVAGTPTGLAMGPKDEPDKIRRALADLRGAGKSVLPRTYVIYTGPDSTDKLLAVVGSYARDGLLADLTVGTHDAGAELGGWVAFVRAIIRRYGSALDSLQITNEPNLTFMDGANPNVQQALVQGVIAAKEQARASNVRVHIGCGSVPNDGPVLPRYWERLAELGGTALAEALDYVGHNFYVDVFEAPLALHAIPAVVERLLRRFREEDLKAGGIPASIPIRITENGWPTGKNPFTEQVRSYERQAEVLETIIRTVDALRHELNITHYELFGLRDADSAKDDLFHQFGIVRDDYTPKPAFSTFQRLIQELGT